MPQILCGDIGGTNCRLAFWSEGQLKNERVYISAEFSELYDAIARYLQETGHQPDRACLGIAGPIHQNHCRTTNLPWDVDGALLSQRLNIPVRLINDFHAAAAGTLGIGPSQWVQIRPGEAQAGAPRAVLGAGTGLGAAFVVGDWVIPGEGGHTDFAPFDARERQLSAMLGQGGRQVCWEDVLSGPGLVNLYRALCLQRSQPEPDWLLAPEAPRWVAERDAEAVRWFWSLYGAEAGNMALRVLARGGVYLCGGIAPKILHECSQSEFLRRFSDKGALSHALDGIPVYVITEPALGLIGAAMVGRSG